MLGGKKIMLKLARVFLKICFRLQQNLQIQHLPTSYLSLQSMKDH